MKVVIPGLAKEYVEKGWWPNKTFIDVANETIRKNADRELVVDGDKRFTFRQIDEMATNLAKNLRHLGVKKGDAISVELPNCYQVFTIHLAIAKLGCVFNPIIPIYRDREVRFTLSREKSVIAIVPAFYRDFDYVEMMQRLKPDLPHLKAVLVWGETQVKDTFSLDEMIESAPDIELTKEDIDPDDIRVTVYTAGTTGEPKGVQHTHNNLMAMENDLGLVQNINENDISFWPMPLCHQMGLNFALDAAFVLGCKVVLQDRWNPEVALKLIEKERCTLTVPVPMMLQSILELPSTREHDTSSLKWFACGGAAVSPRLIERAWDELGWHRACRAYGLSEAPNITNGVPFDAPIEEVRAKGATTDGKIAGNYEAKIVDPSRKELGLGEEGELAVRGPQLFLGYTDPKLNQDCFDEEGWYYTGDIGQLDKEGYWAVTGRLKDIIIRGGENISAKEIEDLLSNHAKIAEVACVAMPDVKMGEKVCTYVKLKEGVAESKLSLEDVTSFLLEQGLSKRKLPEHLEIVSEFPRSSIGKISKVELREDIAKKLGLPPVRT